MLVLTLGRGTRGSLTYRFNFWEGEYGELRGPLHVDWNFGKWATGVYGVPYMLIFTLGVRDYRERRGSVDVDFHFGTGDYQGGGNWFPHMLIFTFGSGDHGGLRGPFHVDFGLRAGTTGYYMALYMSRSRHVIIIVVLVCV